MSGRVCVCGASLDAEGRCTYRPAPAPSPGPDEQGTHTWPCPRFYVTETMRACTCRPTPAAPGTDHSGEVDVIGRRLEHWSVATADGIFRVLRADLGIVSREIARALAAHRPYTEAEEAVRRVRELCDRQDEIARSLGAGFPSQLDVAQVRAALAGDVAVGGGS